MPMMNNEEAGHTVGGFKESGLDYEWTIHERYSDQADALRATYKRQRPRRQAVRRLFEKWISNGRNGHFLERMQTSVHAAVDRAGDQTQDLQSDYYELVNCAADIDSFVLALTLVQTVYNGLSPAAFKAAIALHLATVEVPSLREAYANAYESLAPVLGPDQHAFLATFAFDHGVRASWQHVFLAVLYMRWMPLGWNTVSFSRPAEEVAVFLAMPKLHPLVFGEWVVRSDTISFADVWEQVYATRLAALSGYLIDGVLDQDDRRLSQSPSLDRMYEHGGMDAPLERTKPTPRPAKRLPTAQGQRLTRVSPIEGAAGPSAFAQLAIPVAFETRLRTVHPGVLCVASNPRRHEAAIARLALLRDVIALDMRSPRVPQAARTAHLSGQCTFNEVMDAASIVASDGIARRLVRVGELGRGHAPIFVPGVPWMSIVRVATIVAAVGPAWAGRMRQNPERAMAQLVDQALVFESAETHSRQWGSAEAYRFPNLMAVLNHLGAGESLSEADIAAAVYRLTFVRRRDVSDYAFAHGLETFRSSRDWQRSAATEPRWERPSNQAPDAPLQRVVSEELFYHILHARDIWRTVAERSGSSGSMRLPVVALLDETCSRLDERPDGAGLHLAAPLYGPAQEATFAQALVIVLAVAGAHAFLTLGATFTAAVAAVGVDSRSGRDIEQIAQLLALDVHAPSVLLSILLVALEVQAMDAGGDPLVRHVVHRVFPDASLESIDVERFLVARRTYNADASSDSGTVNLEREMDDREAHGRASLFSVLEVLCALHSSKYGPADFLDTVVRQFHPELARLGASQLALELRAQEYPQAMTDALHAWETTHRGGRDRTADELGALVRRTMLETLDYVGGTGGVTRATGPDRAQGGGHVSPVGKECCVVC